MRGSSARPPKMTSEGVRRLALALPESYERPHRRAPTFWVHNRIFCMMRPGEAHITLKLDRDDQLNMIDGHPDAVQPGRLYPHHGWTYVYPDQTDEALLGLLLKLAWTH